MNPATLFQRRLDVEICGFSPKMRFFGVCCRILPLSARGGVHDSLEAPGLCVGELL